MPERCLDFFGFKYVLIWKYPTTALQSTGLFYLERISGWSFQFQITVHAPLGLPFGFCNKSLNSPKFQFSSSVRAKVDWRPCGRPINSETVSNAIESISSIKCFQLLETVFQARTKYYYSEVHACVGYRSIWYLATCVWRYRPISCSCYA